MITEAYIRRRLLSIDKHALSHNRDEDYRLVDFSDCIDWEAKAFIRECYRRLFSREADIDGFEAYLRASEGGTSNGAIVYLFSQSEEFTQKDIDIMDLEKFKEEYEELLKMKNRDEDYRLVDFSDCIDWEAKAFIRECYRRLFSREADIDGFEAYLRASEGGASNGAIVYLFSQSEEFTQKDIDIMDLEKFKEEYEELLKMKNRKKTFWQRLGERLR